MPGSRFVDRRSGSGGFSLVELSIVLVILGLLVGGILSGQSLIRAAELRSISTSIQRYNTAVYTFRDKYFALPGDMTNATSVWGKDNTNCAGHTGTAATPGTCNGNGDGRMDNPGAASSTGETFQFWKQLSLAGLIEGTYSGLAGSGSARHVNPGVNTPTVKFGPQGGIAMENRDMPGNTTYCWGGNTGNGYIIGGYAANAPPEGMIFKPEELWNIDTKMDDGKPALGNFSTYFRYSYNGNNCVTTDVESTSEYKLTTTTAACNIFSLPGF